MPDARSCAAAFTVLAPLVIGGCSDPSVDRRIEQLPPERSEPNELHRPGQPCVLCHSSSGPASSRFSLAGTVYARRGSPEPAVGVEVHAIAADGGRLAALTNAAGNFFFREGARAIAFPVTVSIEKAGAEKRVMKTLIGREPSCASCHFDPASFARVAPNGEPLRYPAQLRSAYPIVLVEGPP